MEAALNCIEASGVRLSCTRQTWLNDQPIKFRLMTMLNVEITLTNISSCPTLYILYVKLFCGNNLPKNSFEFQAAHFLVRDIYFSE